jgi:hypothetical protein
VPHGPVAGQCVKQRRRRRRVSQSNQADADEQDDPLATNQKGGYEGENGPAVAPNRRKIDGCGPLDRAGSWGSFSKSQRSIDTATSHRG